MVESDIPLQFVSVWSAFAEKGMIELGVRVFVKKRRGQGEVMGCYPNLYFVLIINVIIKISIKDTRCLLKETPDTTDTMIA